MWALVIGFFVWDIQTPAAQIYPPMRWETEDECIAYIFNEGTEWLHTSEDGFEIKAACKHTGQQAS